MFLEKQYDNSNGNVICYFNLYKDVFNLVIYNNFVKNGNCKLGLINKNHEWIQTYDINFLNNFINLDEIQFNSDFIGFEFIFEFENNIFTYEDSNYKFLFYEYNIENDLINMEINSYNHSQFCRYQFVASNLNNNNINCYAWLGTLLRLSNQRRLDWYRHYNYQPKDMISLQEHLSVLLTNEINKAMNIKKNILLKLCLSCIPRGNRNSGDNIRMTVLNIMRNHGIKEGHRPGIEDRFLEEWHQKLHTNTGSDDIIICQAYLNFLNDNNSHKFWDYLSQNKLTREVLDSMTHTIKSTPLYLPQLRHDISNFLNLLKSCHAGVDIRLMKDLCSDQISNYSHQLLDEILNNEGAWWLPGKISDCRQSISTDVWKRDVMMLDLALESHLYFNIGKVQNDIKNADLLNIIKLLITNIFQNTEYSWVIEYYDKLYTNENDPKLLACLENISLIIKKLSDDIFKNLNGNVKILHEKINSPDSKAILRLNENDVNEFAAETIRSTCLFQLSQKLTDILSRFNKNSNLNIISFNKKIIGQIICVNNLDDYNINEIKNVILCCRNINSYEIVKKNIKGIILQPDLNIDILSHLAIRCRNQNVLLMTCQNDSYWQNLLKYESQNIGLDILSSDVLAINSVSDEIIDNSISQENHIIIPLPDKTKKILQGYQEILKHSNSCGNKSKNFATLKKDFPKSAVIPPYLLKSELNNSKTFSKEFTEQFKEKCQNYFNIKNLDQIFPAVKDVYLSASSDRVKEFLSINKINEDKVFMGVLIQEFINSDYSFVCHTRHPVTKENVLMIQITKGAGESLVNSYLGKAMTVVVENDNVQVLNYMSKIEEVVAPPNTLICRSDSNLEDLDNLAAAGLFESVYTKKIFYSKINYLHDRITNDDEYKFKIINNIKEICLNIKKMKNKDQDIEGCIKDDNIYIVQCRAQV